MPLRCQTSTGLVVPECALHRSAPLGTSTTTTTTALRMQWFVVGHDCGHRAFCKNKLVEDIVGTLMFMPLIFPFEPWRIKHNQHHAHTTKCVIVGTS